jgi:probable HAF family extracellular repeat protein
VARDINTYGQVVGYADTSSVSGSARACLWDATGIHNLNLIAGPNGITAASLGWVLTTAYGINDHGQIVGRGVKTGETSTTDAYLWERDAAGNVAVQRVNLGIPNNGAETRGINNAGQVVGSVPNVVSGATLPYASLWQRDLNGVGYNVNLGLLGGNMSHANSINNFAEVVGYAVWANGYPNAFYWSDANGNGVPDSGEMVSLGTLGGLHSVANMINDAGQVVGWAFDAAGAYRAFVWDDVNGMRNLNTLSNAGSNWSLTTACAINNPGRIVGNGSFTVITVGRGNKVTYSTQNHGFLLTP